MKFCKHCGNQIPDNAVCNCPGAVAERQQNQGGYQQPGYQQPGYQQPGYQQPQYAAPRQGKSFGQKLIEPFTIYFKNPKQAVDNRIKDKDFLTPLIYIAALFIIVLGACSCIYGCCAVKGVLVPGNEGVGKGWVNFNFGLTLLAAFILTLGLATAYVMSRFVILIVCGKKPANAGDLLLNSLISFGVNSIIPMGLILVGGLFYMATSMIGWMFFILATIWYVAACLLEIKDDFDTNKNAFVRLLIVGLVTGVMVALFFLLYQGMFAMNVRKVTVSVSSFYNIYN